MRLLPIFRYIPQNSDGVSKANLELQFLKRERKTRFFQYPGIHLTNTVSSEFSKNFRFQKSLVLVGCKTKRNLGNLLSSKILTVITSSIFQTSISDFSRKYRFRRSLRILRGQLGVRDNFSEFFLRTLRTIPRVNVKFR